MAGNVAITTIADSPLSLDEAKDSLRELSADEDGEIQAAIDAVTQEAERRTGRLFRRATCVWRNNAFPEGRDALALPWAPLVSVTSVNYTDTSGNSASVSGAIAEISAVPGEIVPAWDESWPAPVTFPGRRGDVRSGLHGLPEHGALCTEDHAGRVLERSRTVQIAPHGTAHRLHPAGLLHS